MSDNYHFDRIQGLIESYKMGVTSIENVMNNIKSSFTAMSGKPIEIQGEFDFPKEVDDESIHEKFEE